MRGNYIKDGGQKFENSSEYFITVGKVNDFQDYQKCHNFALIE